MSDGVVQVAPDSTGKKIDTSELTVSSQTVERQRIVIADDSTAAGLGKVMNASSTTGSEYGLVVRPVETDVSTSGTITVTDSSGIGTPAGAGALITGTPTASSYVALQCPGGDGNANVLITGLTSGTLYFEGSIDATSATTGNWISLLGKQLGVNTTAYSPTVAISATANGAYKMNITGMSWIRIRSVGTLSGTPAITIRLSEMQQTISLDNALPAVSTTSGAAAIKGGVITSTSTNFAVSATGTVGPVNVTDAGVVTVIVKNQTAASAFTGSPVLVFEQSDDNTSWSPCLVFNNTNGAVASTVTVTAPGANGEVMYDAPLEGVNYFRVRVTTGPTTNPMTVVIQQGTLPFMPVVAVTGSLPAGTNYMGQVRLTDGTNNPAVKAASTAAAAADPSLVVGLSPNSPITMPTPSAFILNSAASTNANSVKASAGTFYGGIITNVNASSRYLKFYNKASAPTVGTDTPDFVVTLPTGSTTSLNPGALGIRFTTGIALAITGGVNDSDTTAIGLGDVKLHLAYI